MSGDRNLARPCPWQRAAWERLCLAMRRERLAHALLCTGPPGSGRGRFALAVARMLLCEKPLAEGNCGECRSCVLSGQGTHADFHVLRPPEPGKRIGIDGVRALLGFSARTSALGRRKVILVTPLEAFTHNAFNAILKGLEEPADNTYLLLVLARGHPVPATIRSRCQQILLPGPGAGEAGEWLRVHLDGDRDAGPRLERGLALLECLPGQPLGVLERLDSDEAEVLPALRAALAERPAPTSLGHLLRLAAPLGDAELLALLQREVHRQGVAAARRGDHALLRRTLRCGDRIASLRDALRSGSNPNSALLRHAALAAWTGLWKREDGATLGASLRA